MEEQEELLHQLLLTVSLVSCFIGIDSRYSCTFAACEERFGPDNDNDDDKWVNEEEGDIDLEEDTDIEEGEVEDLKRDMASKHTPTHTPKKVKAKTTDDLADKLSSTSLNYHGTNFSQSFAKLHFTFREGAKDVAIYEVLAIDQSLLHHVKVLPGGQKLSILFGYPRELASERASRRFSTGWALITIPTITVSNPAQAKLAIISTLTSKSMKMNLTVILRSSTCLSGVLKGHFLATMPCG